MTDWLLGKKYPMIVRQLLYSISPLNTYLHSQHWKAQMMVGSLWAFNQVPQVHSFSEQMCCGEGYWNQEVGKGTKICQFPPFMQLSPLILYVQYQ